MSTTRLLKTPEAARLLAVTYHQLIGLVRFRRINPLPNKDSSGDYLWTDQDLERARQILGDRQERAGAVAG